MIDKVINIGKNLENAYITLGSLIKYVDIVAVDKNNKINTAAVGYDKEKNKYILFYNKHFIENLNDKEIKFLIAHEIAHIIRGDLFVKNKNERIYNIASDYVINNVLLNSFEKDDIPTLYNNGIFSIPEIENENNKNEKTEKYKLGAEYIYNLLIKNRENSNNKGDISGKIFIDDIVYSSDLDEKTIEKAKDIVKKIQVEIAINTMNKNSNSQNQDNNSENNENVIDILGVFAGAPNKNPKIKKISQDYKKQKNTLLEKIIKSINSQFGSYKNKEKSYFRNRAIKIGNKTAIFRKISYKLKNKAFFLIDTSGSYESYFNILIPIVKYFNEKYQIEFGTFSDTFKHYKNLNELKSKGTNIGGGTSIKEAFEFLSKNKYDAIIIFTDGYIFDLNESLRKKVKNKLIWIFDDIRVENTGKKIAQKFNDIIIDNEKAKIKKNN